jgi:hypothetical protein
LISRVVQDSLAFASFFCGCLTALSALRLYRVSNSFWPDRHFFNGASLMFPTSLALWVASAGPRLLPLPP